jgi:hypothetical protein
MPSLTSALPRRRSLDPRPSIYIAQPHFRLWHLSDMAGQADDVRSWGQNGPAGCGGRLPLMTQTV